MAEECLIKILIKIQLSHLWSVCKGKYVIEGMLKKPSKLQRSKVTGPLRYTSFVLCSLAVHELHNRDAFIVIRFNYLIVLF